MSREIELTGPLAKRYPTDKRSEIMKAPSQWVERGAFTDSGTKDNTTVSVNAISAPSSSFRLFNKPKKARRVILYVYYYKIIHRYFSSEL